MMHDGWMSWDSAGGFGRMWFGPIIWIMIGFAIYAGGSSISKRGQKDLNLSTASRPYATSSTSALRGAKLTRKNTVAGATRSNS